MKAPSASPRWNRHPSFRQVSVLEADERVVAFGESEDHKEHEESSPALLTGIETTEAQRSAARHEKILFNMLYLPLLTDTISNIDKDITLSGISQLGRLSNTQKKRSAAARARSARAFHFWVNCFQDDTRRSDIRIRAWRILPLPYGMERRDLHAHHQGPQRLVQWHDACQDCQC